jgi:hypothetical protein
MGQGVFSSMGDSVGILDWFGRLDVETRNLCRALERAEIRNTIQ